MLVVTYQLLFYFQGDAILGVKRDFSELWSAEIIGTVRRAHVMSTREVPTATGGWCEPTFMCDLQLPRFALQPCLVVTSCGAYVMNTVYVYLCSNNTKSGLPGVTLACVSKQMATSCSRQTSLVKLRMSVFYTYNDVSLCRSLGYFYF